MTTNDKLSVVAFMTIIGLLVGSVLWLSSGNRIVTGYVMATSYSERPYPHTAIYLMYRRVNMTIVNEESYDHKLLLSGDVTDLQLGKLYGFRFHRQFWNMYATLDSSEML